jgi:hypothetical protein
MGYPKTVSLMALQMEYWMAVLSLFLNQMAQKKASRMEYSKMLELEISKEHSIVMEKAMLELGFENKAWWSET